MTTPLVRHRPIIGGVFGAGRYALATMPLVLRGLHSVRFMVIEPLTGGVLSIADGKTEALNAARALILADAEFGTTDELPPKQAELWPGASAPAVLRPIVDRRRPVSRRRRVIFAKCGGQCHYCSAPLQLDGVWHVEHMLPRALGGADDAGNLVAACAPCNLSKRDRTALEFVASSLGDEGRS